MCMYFAPYRLRGAGSTSARCGRTGVRASASSTSNCSIIVSAPGGTRQGCLYGMSLDTNFTTVVAGSVVAIRPASGLSPGDDLGRMVAVAKTRTAGSLGGGDLLWRAHVRLKGEEGLVGGMSRSFGTCTAVCVRCVDSV